MNASSPFFVRGDYYIATTNGGPFAFSRTAGESLVGYGFRVAVLYSDIKKTIKEMLSPKNTCLGICIREYQRSLIPLM